MGEVVEHPALAAPTPAENSDTAEFWAAAGEGRLLIRRCLSCGEAIWYPRPICPFCHSTETAWEEASGRGLVYSYTVIRRAGGAFGGATPYVLAYVELDEGPRITTNIVDCEPELLRIGAEVEVVFHRTEGGTALPRFRPR